METVNITCADCGHKHAETAENMGIIIGNLLDGGWSLGPEEVWEESTFLCPGCFDKVCTGI